MAVSHQWFVQWTAPPVLFADITSQYNGVNERWNNDKPKWSDPLVLPEQSDDSYNDDQNQGSWKESNKYKFKSNRLKNNGELWFFFNNKVHKCCCHVNVVFRCTF